MVVKNVKFTRAEIKVLACFTLDNIKPSIIAKILNNSVRTIYTHLNQIKRKANIQTIDDIPLFIKSSKEFNKLKGCFNSQYIDYYFRIMAKKIKDRLKGLSITCFLITPSESANNKIINEIIELIELAGIHVKQDNYIQPISDVLNKNEFHLFIYRNINEIEKSAKTLTQNSLSLVLDKPPNSKQLLRENYVVFFDQNNKKEFYKFFVDYLLKNYEDSINISEIKNFSSSIDNITSSIQYDFFKNLPNSNTSKNKLTKFNYFLISTLVICILLGINYWYNRDTNGSVDIHSVNTKNLRAVKAWYLPYRNNKFTGREGVFKTIKDNLDKSNIGIITQSISGVGGIGKTQLATEYAYRAIENREYDIILWVTAESQNSINSSYDAFASKLTINSHGLQPAQLRKSVHSKLLNEYKVNKILFIFDNVPQEKNFQQYLTELHNQFPISTQLHVLITSRSQHWTEDAFILDVFAEQEAKEFIKKHLSNENEQDIIKLTKALHYFPLALGQAVGYIKQHTNIVDYLQLYESNQLQFLNIPPKDNNQYIKSLWQTTIISLDKLSIQAKRMCNYSAIKSNIFSKNA